MLSYHKGDDIDYLTEKILDDIPFRDGLYHRLDPWVLVFSIHDAVLPLSKEKSSFVMVVNHPNNGFYVRLVGTKQAADSSARLLAETYDHTKNPQTIGVSDVLHEDLLKQGYLFFIYNG